MDIELKRKLKDYIQKGAQPGVDVIVLKALEKPTSYKVSYIIKKYDQRIRANDLIVDKKDLNMDYWDGHYASPYPDPTMPYEQK